MDWGPQLLLHGVAGKQHLSILRPGQQFDARHAKTWTQAVGCSLLAKVNFEMLHEPVLAHYPGSFELACGFALGP